MNDNQNREKIIVRTSVVGIVVNLLLAAFKAIPNMQGRLKIVELAERMAREKCAAHMRAKTPAVMSR